MKAKIQNQTVKASTPQDKPFEVRDTEIKGFLLRVQPSGSKTFYLEYRQISGKKQRYRIGNYPSMTPTAARAAASELYADAAKGVDLQLEKKVARDREAKAKYETLGGFIEHWYSPWAKAHQKRGQETLTLLQSSFQELYSKRLDQITSWDIQRWRTERRKSGLKATTINRRVSTLKAVLNRAVDAEVISNNPLGNVKPLRVDDNSRVRFLSEEEEIDLRVALDERQSSLRAGRDSGNRWRATRGHERLSALDGTFVDHLKPMVLLALNTGMRRGEIFSLRWPEVDFKRNTVTIIGVYSKSGKTRHINLNSDALRLLKDWSMQSSAALVFPNHKTGEAFDNIKHSWTRLRAMAGLKDFRFHDLRHTFASKLVMAGVDLYTVKELMGHSTVQMTERYSHLAPEHKAKAVELLVRGQ
jgi:integrase